MHTPTTTSLTTATSHIPQTTTPPSSQQLRALDTPRARCNTRIVPCTPPELNREIHTVMTWQGMQPWSVQDRSSPAFRCRQTSRHILRAREPRHPGEEVRCCVCSADCVRWWPLGATWGGDAGEMGGVGTDEGRVFAWQLSWIEDGGVRRGVN